MRITKPLIGTAAGAAVLGATLALGLSMASASASSTTASTAAAQRSSTATSAKSAAAGRPWPVAEGILGTWAHAGRQVYAYVRVRQVPGQQRARSELMAPGSY